MKRIGKISILLVVFIGLSVTATDAAQTKTILFLYSDMVA